MSQKQLLPRFLMEQETQKARNVMGRNQLVLVIMPVVFNGTKKKDKLVKWEEKEREMHGVSSLLN